MRRRVFTEYRYVRGLVRIQYRCGRRKSGSRFVCAGFWSLLSSIEGKEGKAVGRWRREALCAKMMDRRNVWGQ